MTLRPVLENSSCIQRGSNIADDVGEVEISSFCVLWELACFEKRSKDRGQLLILSHHSIMITWPMLAEQPFNRRQGSFMGFIRKGLSSSSVVWIVFRRFCSQSRKREVIRPSFMLVGVIENGAIYRVYQQSNLSKIHHSISQWFCYVSCFSVDSPEKVESILELTLVNLSKRIMGTLCWAALATSCPFVRSISALPVTCLIFTQLVKTLFIDNPYTFFHRRGSSSQERNHILVKITDLLQDYLATLKKYWSNCHFLVLLLTIVINIVATFAK